MLALLVLVVSAAAPAGPGAGAAEIVLGSSTSLSGPRAWSGEQATKFGVDLYLRVVNDAGGIAGRKVRAAYRDDGGRPEAAAANVRRLVDEDAVLAVLAPQGERAIVAALPVLEQARVPLLVPLAGSPALRASKYVLGAPMLYDRQARLMAAYLVGQRKYRRFAAIYQDDAYGKTFVAALASALQRQGARLVGSERIGADLGDVDGPVARLRVLGPDVAVLVATPRAAGAILRERLRVGWSRTLMVAAGPLMDELYLTVAGGVAEGVEGLALWPDPIGSDLPGVKRYREHLAKHFPGTPPNRASLAGYFAALLFTEAARRAAPGLTRERLVASLAELREFDSGILPPLTLAAEHEADRQGLWVRMEQGRFKPLTGWLRGG
jgi:ABC-type branched-subunit amino acid transport system substrate-binding protein